MINCDINAVSFREFDGQLLWESFAFYVSFIGPFSPAAGEMSILPAREMVSEGEAEARDCEYVE